jgi:hypothetical protein
VNQLNTQQTPSNEISVTGARIDVEESSKNGQKMSASICHLNRNFDKIIGVLPDVVKLL